MRYKAVRKGRYQAGREVDTESETDSYNYGLVVAQESNQEYFALAIELSEEYGIPLGKFAECAIEGEVPDDEDFWNENMPDSVDRDRLSIELEAVEYEGAAEVVVGLREALVERVREETDPFRPSRLTSIFACDTIDDVRRYRAEHTDSRVQYVECSIETIHESASFRGDMHLLDRIDLVCMDTEAAARYARRYWEGQATPDPLYETLLQGRFRFGAPVVKK
jgi:hypothetical protein